MTMTWRLQVLHRTHLRYDGDARASYNEVRMVPSESSRQVPLGAHLTVQPNAPIWTYNDYWGTHVGTFDLQDPHHELVVTALSTVETSCPGPLPVPLDWAELRAAGGRLLEFLPLTPRTRISEELAATARDMVAGADPHEAATALGEWVADTVAYVPGATEVQTGAQQAWDKGQGVCQDLAHLTIGLLRVVGFPARYVSGYLHPDADAEPGDARLGESHAWVEYWAGEWVAYDPTTRVPAGACHVTVAQGRDYADVPPLKGIYHGAPSREMDVTVEVTRIA
jgi:transglutaminase-like putative cysteine protease